MHNIETFAVIGGDLRSSYLAKALANDGYKVITAGFDATELPAGVTGCTNPTQAVALADCVIFPMPVTADGVTVNAPFSRSKIRLDAVLNELRPHQKVFGGSVSAAVQMEAQSRGVVMWDYLLREELAIKNAVSTAEGALQLMMEELPTTVRDSHVLITGYGRIGKVLAQMLLLLGCRVTVAARKLSALAWAQTAGCATIPIDQLHHMGRYDVVFNTVPYLLFNRELIEKMDKNVLLIDLASRPGGVDFEAAADLGVKTIWALSLPGKVAPQTSGEIIRDTILQMLKEQA